MTHSHPHVDDMQSNRLLLAVIVNVLLTVVQIIGGLVSGSLALIADAIHNLSDAGSLIVALVARKISRRPADDVMTFGYGRAEIIGALVNFTTLILIGLYLIYEAIFRLASPEPIAGWIVVIVAGVALVVDIATAMLTYTMSKESMNVRAAFIHNVSDALASVGVMIAGSLIILFDWTIADALVTISIAGYVLYHGAKEIGGAIRILMSAALNDGDLSKAIKVIESVDRVQSVHHVHLWAMDEHAQSLEAHVVVDVTDIPGAEIVKKQVKERLQEQADIRHTTLEIEYVNGGEACHESERLGPH